MDLSAQRTAGAAHSARPRDSGVEARPRRILVADDNVDGADVLAMVLRLAGFDVAVAYDGETALALACELQPDVLVLDLGMPKLGGLAVARAVRGTNWGRRTLLVALTGWGSAEDRAKTREAGFDHHHTKPIDPDELIDLVNSAQVCAFPARPERSR